MIKQKNLLTAGKRVFLYAPPLKGVRPSKRKPAKPPFAGAKPYQCSVYYYWWEFLRRHEGYKVTCKNRGTGKYAKLYADFGNVHEGEFWDWWVAHQHLFSEPPIPSVKAVEKNDVAEIDDGVVLVAIPLEQRLSFSIRQIRKLLVDKVIVQARSKTKSRALYPVATKPVLSGLHSCLMVWDAYQRYPRLPLYLIKDFADRRVSADQMEEFKRARNRAEKDSIGGDKYGRRAKTLAAGRYIRMAKSYIKYVGLGRFPAS